LTDKIITQKKRR